MIITLVSIIIVLIALLVFLVFIIASEVVNSECKDEIIEGQNNMIESLNKTNEQLEFQLRQKLLD